jgi:hypothetical protein
MEGTAMRHLLLAALTALFAATAAPAFAASMFDFLFSGTVASDMSFGPPLPLVFGQNLTGKPFHVSESFNLAKASFIIPGMTYVGDSNFASAEITIGNVSAPFRNDLGGFFPAAEVGGFFSSLGTRMGNSPLGNGFSPSLGFQILFDSNGFEAQANLDLIGPLAISGRDIEFNVTSDTLVLSPVLSPVPLPPSLPLFAAALLALGIFGYVRRTKDVSAIQA